MENFIVYISLLATAIGSLVLLSCMAGKRESLFRAYIAQKEAQLREKMAEQTAQKHQAETIPTVAAPSSEVTTVSGGAAHPA